MSAEAVLRPVLAIAKRGDVVFVECDRVLKTDQRDSLREIAAKLFKDTGVQIVFLEAGMKVARIEQ